MEDFRKNMRSRQLLLVAGLLGAVCLVMLSRNYDKAPPVSDLFTTVPTSVLSPDIFTVPIS